MKFNILSQNNKNIFFNKTIFLKSNIKIEILFNY